MDKIKFGTDGWRGIIAKDFTVDTSIKITYKKEKPFRPLTAKDVVLPGGIKPTDEQWEEYLDRKDERKPITIQQLRKKLEKRYAKK